MRESRMSSAESRVAVAREKLKTRKVARENDRQPPQRRKNSPYFPRA